MVIPPVDFINSKTSYLMHTFKVSIYLNDLVLTFVGWKIPAAEFGRPAIFLLRMWYEPLIQRIKRCLKAYIYSKNNLHSLLAEIHSGEYGPAIKWWAALEKHQLDSFI